MDTFPGKRQDIRSYSALSLAYIGDVVYDLIIRTVVVSRANRPVNDLDPPVWMLQVLARFPLVPGRMRQVLTRFPLAPQPLKGRGRGGAGEVRCMEGPLPGGALR